MIAARSPRGWFRVARWSLVLLGAGVVLLFLSALGSGSQPGNVGPPPTTTPAPTSTTSPPSGTPTSPSTGPTPSESASGAPEPDGESNTLAWITALSGLISAVAGLVGATTGLVAGLVALRRSGAKAAVAGPAPDDG